MVGEYFSDTLVDDKVTLEIKSIVGLTDPNEAQLLNYLCGTDIEVGMLLNFGPKPEFRRKVYDNARKKSLPKTDQQNPR